MGIVCLHHSQDEFRELIVRGTNWARDRGFSTDNDLERTDEHGCIRGADPEKMRHKAIERGYTQVGSLGSGNHYLEVQVARQKHVVDPLLARAMGIDVPDQVVLMLRPRLRAGPVTGGEGLQRSSTRSRETPLCRQRPGKLGRFIMIGPENSHLHYRAQRIDLFLVGNHHVKIEPLGLK